MPTDVKQGTAETANLTYNGTSLSLPVIKGTEDETAVDIEKLRSATGLITLDPGYGNTGACRSAITFIDGEKGILRYRGYPIEELAARSTFLEVAYLLIHGELPTRGELDGFTHEVTIHTMLHQDFGRFFDAPPEGRASDAGLRGRGRRARDLLPEAGERAAHPRDDHSPDREDADDRSLLLQALDRTAVRVPAEPPGLHLELPQHDVRCA
jgi:citrate synthase